MIMSPHLSPEQFARCFVGVASSVELHHISDCGSCRAELEGFQNSISSLRHALRAPVDVAVRFRSPQPAPVPRFRPVLVAAALVLIGMVPLLTQRPANPLPESGVSSPEALMNAVNRHLSRTLPEPMQPVMSLLPDGEPQFVLGEIK